MDVQKFIQDKLTKKAKERDDALARYALKRKKLEEIKAIIENDPNLPETTDLLKTLESYIGKTVTIKTNLDETITEKFDYDPESRRILVDHGFSTHLIYGDYVKSVIDAETGKVIFENKYKDMPIPMQNALLFGKKEGLKSVKSEFDECTYWENYNINEYEDTKKAFENIPVWIERGEKLIYPQKLEKWSECVCHRAGDLYHGIELVNAIEVMEALDSGKSMQEVKKIISSGHSGASYGILVNIVTNFSKRGPEFCRANSESYKYALSHGTKAEIREWKEWLEKLEKENQQYESELNANGKGSSQPHDD